MVGIYKITNPKNAVYIGQSRVIKERLARHKRLGSEKCRKLYNSLVKYGPENHKFELIYELPTDVSNSVIDDYEIFYLAQFKEAGYELLNLKDGGSFGGHTEETKEKIRLITTGKKQSAETIAKRVQKNTGKKRTPEQREKLSAWQVGVPKPEVQVLKMRQTKKGVKLTPSARVKVLAGIEKRRGYKHTEATKKLISEKLKGKKFTAERKKKLSIAWINRKPVTLETREKLRQSALAFYKNKKLKAWY